MVDNIHNNNNTTTITRTVTTLTYQLSCATSYITSNLLKALSRSRHRRSKNHLVVNVPAPSFILLSPLPPDFYWGSCYSIFSFISMFCRSLFVLLYFFFWPLCCLFFFDIRILIAPLVSSNSFLNTFLHSLRFSWEDPIRSLSHTHKGTSRRKEEHIWNP